MATDQSTGRLIQEAREAADWTRTAVSNKTGIGLRRLETIERNGVVTMPELRALINALPDLTLESLGLADVSAAPKTRQHKIATGRGVQGQ